MALPTDKTDICNLALSRIGAKEVTTAELTADTETKAKHCNRNYEQTRDALLRSNSWRFASDRAALTQVATPPFEYSHAYKLPDDFLLMKSIYDSSRADNKYRKPYDIEGVLIKLNETSCMIKYTKKVTDVTKFDPLFTEVFVLSLALKLVMPLSQDRALYDEIKDELYKQVIPKVRAVDRQETNTSGNKGKRTWNESRY